MAMSVLYSSSAMSALGELNKNSSALAKDLKKVSIGMRVNGAGDDAAGYSISEKMRVQLRGLEQDVRNVQNGQKLLRTAEGAVASTVDILRTMKEKALNAANDTNTDDDRAIIQKEIDRLVEQVDENAYITYNGKYILNAPGYTVPMADESDDSVEAAIVRALHSEWFQSCLDLLGESFDMSFDESGTTVNTINVEFGNDGGNALAYVSHTYNTATGETTGLLLHINMDYYGQLNTKDVNGSTATAGAGYLDRTLAHELTHALMAANITHFDSLPLYVMEGMAELVHGIDDQRTGSILNYAQKSKAADTANVLANSGNYKSGEEPYAIGYTLLHYMAKKGAASTGNSQLQVIKDFMKVLDDSTVGGMTAYDDAINTATGGLFADSSALTSAYIDDVTADGGDGTAADAVRFLKDYCGIVMYNADTGAATGSDMGGSVTKTAESIVPEEGPTSKWTLPTSVSTTFVGGLTAIWPSEYVDLLGGITSKEEGSPGVMYLQVGTKANQTTMISFGDMRAKALGLRDAAGNTISVNPRENAEKAIDIFDAALDKALEEQTNIGALQVRLSYTADNLTTANENTQGAESVIRDADMAKEMASYTRSNVLQQAAQSMLAQANQNLSAVLALLQ